MPWEQTYHCIAQAPHGMGVLITLVFLACLGFCTVIGMLATFAIDAIDWLTSKTITQRQEALK